jgi:hypothetical protein
VTLGLFGYSPIIKHLTEGSGGACGSLRSGSYEGVLGKGTTGFPEQQPEREAVGFQQFSNGTKTW